MMVTPDRDQIRGEIERHLRDGEWVAARTALERLWRIQPSAALAAYVSAGFERLRGRLDFHRCRVAILRSFTLDPVIPLLRAAAWVNGIELTAELGEFNAYAQELHDPKSWVYQFSPDVAILAVQTQDLAPALWEESADLSEAALRETVRQILEDFGNWIYAFRSHGKGYLLLHTFEVPYPLNRGILDAQNAFGQAEAVREINSGLRRLVAGNRGVHLLDYDAVVAAHGKARWRDEHKWATVKLPLRAECMAALAGEWVRHLAPMCGRTCKVLVCDLDNTLWGGVIGEVGVDGIQVDREYPGIAYRKVQRALLDLKRRGIILAVASKNNREDAVEALRRHPGMLLRPEDFAAERINWCDKAQSLREIAAELNVGLDSLAFLDDNPVERERIKSELPEVTVLELPDDPMGFADAPRSHPALERIALSPEDCGAQPVLRRAAVARNGSRQRSKRRGVLPLARARGRDPPGFQRDSGACRAAHAEDQSVQPDGTALPRTAAQRAAGLARLGSVCRAGEGPFRRQRTCWSDADPNRRRKLRDRYVPVELPGHQPHRRDRHARFPRRGVPCERGADTVRLVPADGQERAGVRLLSQTRIRTRHYHRRGNAVDVRPGPLCDRMPRVDPADYVPEEHRFVNTPSLDRVQRIFSDVFQIPREHVKADSSPDTISNWDSLQHLNLVLALEQEFNVQFTPEEIEQLLSVELVAALLQEKRAACEVP